MNDKFIGGLGSASKMSPVERPRQAPANDSDHVGDTTSHPHPAQRGRPVYDEEELVEEFVARATAAIADYEFELVLVNDGSSDGTPELLDRIAAADPRVRVIHLSRNFGHQAALTAGLEHAVGDVVAMIDADLQDPPELIPEMIAQWSQGSDVVYAVRKQREGETAFKLATASWFYKLFDKLAQVDLEPNSGDFRLLDRRALDALLSMTERSRFLRGMTVWVGFTQTAVSYQRDARHAGETKYTLRKMLRFSLDAIASFSHLPLQLATYAGLLSRGPRVRRDPGRDRACGSPTPTSPASARSRSRSCCSAASS